MNMKQNTTSIIVAVTILLACVVQARYTDDDLDRFTEVFTLIIPGEENVERGKFGVHSSDKATVGIGNFVKRQMADAKASEYLALIRLGLARGCREIGCGVIDFQTRFAKRSWSDQRIADYQARLALYQGGPLLTHGQFDTNKIFEKRTSSDQRIAELQALIALSRGSGIVGHGRIDPYGIGRRKRDTGILRTLINKNRLLQNSDDSHL